MKPSLIVAAFLALSPPLLNAASDYFLKIDGIKGESSDTNHRDEIEISSWSWGASNPVLASGGGGTGKVSMQDFHFVCSHDKSSPLLMLSCAQGTHIPKVVLTVRRTTPAGAPEEYLTITLEEVLVSSFSSSAPPPSGGAQAPPTQSISLNFTKITFEHTSNGSVTKAGWDVKANVKI
jgi:type VI secretion system secreted protein Hcp